MPLFDGMFGTKLDVRNFSAFLTHVALAIN